ncbi:MAG: tetraacyldisaccharide 4'-kinase [Alistipes sp.]|nr:tetraacyldisaccharide 4'-kinase [Alistipes sp.]
MKELLLKIASLLYYVGIKFRSALFDMGILSSESFEIPIICVGNITAGGTGKTPTVETLVSYYSERCNVVVLSRGYGRKTKGYREVEADDDYRTVGDEPLQIKRKFPNVRVVVCAKRVFAIKRIMAEFPEVDMIIMDDGFQHRYVRALVNIIIVDATRPVDRDHLLPYGQLRDTVSSLSRANYFIVTKCAPDMKPLETRLMRAKLVKKPSQDVFFSRMAPSEPSAVFAGVTREVKAGSEVIAMSGIGNSEAFNESLRHRYTVVDTIDLEDHHVYRMNDLKRMQELLDRYPKAVIMTTEKDAVKLYRSGAIPESVRSRMFYESITLRFMGDGRTELFSKIDKDIKNRRNGEYIRGL